MGLFIDGIAASEHVDSSGEILAVEGCDISTLAESGTLNFEHNNDEADDVVGKILYAKKIFSEKDCENDRQLGFYKKVNCPYVYIIGELFDSEGHPGALALAAMCRYSKKKNEPMLVGMSIEGSTLERDGMYLKRTVARRTALTVKPCNKSCISDILEQIPDAKKAMGSDGFKPLHKSIEVDFEEFSGEIPSAYINAFQDLADFLKLRKALDAGMPSAAPGQNVQGASLQKLDQNVRNKILEKIRDKWDRITPIREFLKSEMPELGERFKDHFSELMGDLKLFKSSYTPDIVSYRSSLAHIPHTKEQKLLIAGLKSNKAEDSSHVRSMNSSGDRVLLRRGYNSPQDKVFSSEKAAAFHNLARDFFGLGDNVPMTSAYKNPADGHVHHATRALNGVISGMHPKYAAHYDKAIKGLASSGLLHKLAIMDYVLGHSNRHINNLVIDPKQQKPYLISNEKSFGEPNLPDYWHIIPDSERIIDQDTRDWASKLDPKSLIELTRHNGMPKKHAEAAAKRLDFVKNKVSSNPDILEIYHGEE